MKLRTSIWLSGFLLLATTLSACNLGATPAPTQDVVAIQSTAMAQVVSTVSAQQTQTAAAIPPTAIPTDTLLPTFTLQPTFAPAGGSTPFAFDTPLPGLTPLAIASPTLGAISTVTTKNGCNDALYLGEDPYYTDAGHRLEVNIGQVVEQYFRLKNTGTCNWDEGYAFVFQPEYSSPEVSGNTVTLVKNKASDYTMVGNEVRYKAIMKAPKVAGNYQGFWKLRADDGSEFGPLVSLYITVRKP
ncbi:MAG: NBR1-Ig-like domain-containing protein [Anaerolineales bacterium]